MRLLLPLLLVVVFIVIVALALRSGRGDDREELARQTAELEAAQRRLNEAEALIRQLRELTWEHREQGPVLADVLLAEIRRFEDRPPELG